LSVTPAVRGDSTVLKPLKPLSTVRVRCESAPKARQRPAVFGRTGGRRRPGAARAHREKKARGGDLHLAREDAEFFWV
jgi:hypothetical protein